MNISDVVRFVSRRALPGGKNFRKLPFGPIAGSTMKLNFHYDLRLYLGMYEKETKAWFPRLVKKGYQSFDVGGAGGYDAMLLSKLSSGGKVVSFECDKTLADEMRETFRRNPYPIETVEGFVSDRDDGEEVTIDAAARRSFVPDFIKIDIEGAEDRALLGASEVIAVRKPNMIIEVHGKHKEERCLEILKGFGYSPTIVDRNTKFLGEKRPLDEYNRWLICQGSDNAR